MEKNKQQKKGAIYTFIILVLAFAMCLGVGIFVLIEIINEYKAGEKVGILWLPCIFGLSLGGIGLTLLIVATIKEKIAKKNFKNKLDGEDENDEYKPLPEVLEAFKNAIPSVTKTIEIAKNTKQHRYTFKQGKHSVIKYHMYDDSNKLVYESRKLKSTFMSGIKMSFDNHLTNKSIIYHVGRILVGSGSYTSGNPVNSPFSFRLDNMNLNDLFEKLEIFVNIKGPNILNIIYKNTLIGTIEIIPLKGINWTGRKKRDCIICCYDEFLDVAFLVAFAMSYSTIQ